MNQDKASVEKLFDKLNIELTEEEKRVLEQIGSKMDQANIPMPTSSGVYDPFKHANHPKHATEYPREILVELRMEMTEIDDKGHLIGVNDILHTFYYIPILPNTDYKKSADGFMDKLDEELTNLGIEIHSHVQPEQK